MPNINFLIKPASSKCNVNCNYCFYNDISNNRDVFDYGMMTIDTAENLIKKASDFAKTGHVSFGFQGGEPTLIGLEFYKTFIELVKKHFENNDKIHYSLQTNGLLIDEHWAQLFKDNNFLIGLSIDGTKEVHNLNRTDHKGDGTYKRVNKAAELLSKYGVDYNILTVINKVVTRKISSIYKEYRRKGYTYLQFIPCLDPLGKKRGLENFSLKPEDYTKFLMNLFDLWYEDISKDQLVSIRFFDNILGMYLGVQPESCDMVGRCSIQQVVEADGSVYPCDFYVLDDLNIGNINTDELTSMHKNPAAINFVEESLKLNDKCKTCEWMQLCKGGCKRSRDDDNLNYYCESFKEFYAYSRDRFYKLAKNYQHLNKLK